jgi:hypothetical protein
MVETIKNHYNYIFKFCSAFLFRGTLSELILALHKAGNTKGGRITLLLTSCLAGLESAV